MHKYLLASKKFWEKEIKSHRFTYILLALILLISIFLRVYRTEDLLRFYFDQGRDALVIWRLWHEGKFFLIGPVTGLAGIFLGPFYYYLIAPFYLVGGGNPVYPAVFLAFLSTTAIAVTYYLGWQMQSRVTGIIAAVISGFSYYMVLAGRWLANPTPILLSSVLLLLSMWKLVEGKTKNKKMWWFVIAFLVGISIHLEAASAVFYIPLILVFYVFLYFINKKMLPHRKTFKISLIIFIISFFPQIFFNFRHENILFNNFKKVFFEERSFRSPIGQNLITKKSYFWGVFSSKIFPGHVKFSDLYYYAALLGLVVSLTKRTRAIFLIVIFLGVPLVGYLFYQGNYGNIYDYYMTGYYLPMILLFSLGLGFLWKNIIGKLIVFLFLVSFLGLNLTLDKNLILAGVDGPTHITLGNQLQSVDWIFNNAQENQLKEYNVDVYVPPVIPHAYDYLLLWQGTLRQKKRPGCREYLCGIKKEPQLPIVYVLYEVDPPHPERLETWLARYENTTLIEESISFGGITIERRKRI